MNTSTPWNTSGIGVFKYSWVPGRWQFSVWHPNGADFGVAPSESEAWTKARAILRFHTGEHTL